jgi:hypothetical protein
VVVWTSTHYEQKQNAKEDVRMSFLDASAERTNTITRSSASVKMDPISIQKILVLVDGTEISFRAADYAANVDGKVWENVYSQSL